MKHKKTGKIFPAVSELRNDLLTQGYGADCAKIVHPTIHPSCVVIQALQAGIDRSGVLRSSVATS
jgi:hypothetical protein